MFVLNYTILFSSCADGAGSFHSLHQQIKAAANINNKRCRNRAGIELPAKWEIKEIVERAALKLGFNPNCQENRQADEPPPRLRLEFDNDDGDSGIDEETLSPTQRYTVCNLREKPTENSEIASILGVGQELVDDVRCRSAKKFKEELQACIRD